MLFRIFEPLKVWPYRRQRSRPLSHCHHRLRPLTDLGKEKQPRGVWTGQGGTSSLFRRHTKRTAASTLHPGELNSFCLSKTLSQDFATCWTGQLGNTGSSSAPPNVDI